MNSFICRQTFLLKEFQTVEKLGQWSYQGHITSRSCYELVQDLPLSASYSQELVDQKISFRNHTKCSLLNSHLYNWSHDQLILQQSFQELKAWSIFPDSSQTEAIISLSSSVINLGQPSSRITKQLFTFFLQGPSTWYNLPVWQRYVQQQHL